MKVILWSYYTSHIIWPYGVPIWYGPYGMIIWYDHMIWTILYNRFIWKFVIRTIFIMINLKSNYSVCRKRWNLKWKIRMNSWKFCWSEVPSLAAHAVVWFQTSQYQNRSYKIFSCISTVHTVYQRTNCINLSSDPFLREIRLLQ